MAEIPVYGLYLEDSDEQTLMNLTDELIASKPKTVEAVVEIDGLVAAPVSENPLDVSIEYSRRFSEEVRSSIYCINRVLLKHEKVRVNLPMHWETQEQLALMAVLQQYYNGNSRVALVGRKYGTRTYQVGDRLVWLSVGRPPVMYST
jgi:hypothetical protein